VPTELTRTWLVQKSEEIEEGDQNRSFSLMERQARNFVIRTLVTTLLKRGEGGLHGRENDRHKNKGARTDLFEMQQPARKGHQLKGEGGEGDGGKKERADVLRMLRGNGGVGGEVLGKGVGWGT